MPDPPRSRRSSGRSRRLRAAAALLPVALWLAAGCAGAPGLPGAATARPALWHAEAPGRGELYLLGSVHMGRGPVDLGRRVEAAWAEAEELVVEVDIETLPPSESVALTRRYGTLPPSLRLPDVLSPQTWGLLDAYLALRGLDPAGFLPLKPWFVSFTIVQIELQRAGYDAAYGIDRRLLERARGQKTVAALETAASQLATMDRLPASLQDLMLRDVLARIDSFPEETGRLVEAWREGDTARLERLVFSPLGELPELEIFYELVFYQRNERMAEDLAELSRDGRTRFVVVGAGHLVGERGVPELLGRRGFAVERVR